MGPHTWKEFIALAEDDRRELVDGELVEVEVPKKWHERMVLLIAMRLESWARRRGWVVLPSGYKVRVSRQRGAMPDVQVLTAATYRSAGEDGLADGRPEIAVEIVSPRSRAHDRVRKLQWYASIGVPEYWIVDARDRTLERLVLVRGSYEVAETVEGDATFRPRGLAGLSIPLAELWEALDAPRARRRGPSPKR